MKAVKAALLALLVFALAPESHAATTWAQGKHYSLLAPVQRTTVPAGKVEVMEVFSYGCPACNSFQPVVEKLKHDLPANAQMVFLPASFYPPEAWPMFQRAYFAAQSLGVADSTHQAVYDAADAQVEAMAVPGTPCIVVNGKYRVNLDSLSTSDELIGLVKFLVAKETSR